MEHRTIVVPKDITFISDWSKLEGGYRLENYPYPHIVNKQITGCGFTEYCLTNDQNVILCSPRRILLENKESQHPGEVFYARSISDANITAFDEDFNQEPKNGPAMIGIIPAEKEKKDDAEEIKRNELSLQDRIKDYFLYCTTHKRPCKIIVTYDSFRHVVDALKQYIVNFFVVVDEFQSIFVDSRFKSTTESEFVSYLQGIEKVCFVSATPMIDKYLDMLAPFNALPYLEFDWISEDPGRLVKPRLTLKSVASIFPDVSRIIDEYKSGVFAKYSYKDESGRINEIESREAVFYVNSVENIKTIISKNGLTQEECNVLCARTPQNEDKIRKAFKVSKKNFQGLGSIPKKGEPHKMFTFCTRTVYLGADFYSTNARTFVFSDANIDSLSVDITLDLPQILGRQRLTINPWKNTAELYFKPILAAKAMTEEELNRKLQEKIRRTNSMLSIVDDLSNPSQKMDLIDSCDIIAQTNKYKKDYISVNHHQGSTPVPVFNELVMISEKRAFDIQQVDYRDRFNVMKALNNSGPSYDVQVDVLNEALATFDSLKTFMDKMKFICTDGFGNFEHEIILSLLQSVDVVFLNYYQTIGPERIMSLYYHKNKVKEEYERLKSNQASESELKDAIEKTFRVGERYTLRYIKSELDRIYKEVNYKQAAKASNLSEYFNIRRCNITNPETKKKEEGFEILSIKGEEGI